MKVIYIGGNHAGTLSMKELRAKHPDVKVTLYEENTKVSFLACGIALSLSGIVKNMQDLFYSSLQELESEGIEVHQSCKVIKVDKLTKTLTIKNLVTEEIFTDTYDKLVVATGSWPIVPPIKGVDAKNVHLSKTYQQAQKLLEYVKDESIKKVSIVGAGYIGIELAEAFAIKGKEVTLIDSCSTLLDKYYNQDFAQPILEELPKHNIKLVLNQCVEHFNVNNDIVDSIVTKDGTQIATDLVVMCVGFKPNTKLFEGVVELSNNKAIIVDKYRYSSDENILAIGDCATINNNATNQLHSYIALASNAIRTGICAANNIVDKEMEFGGVQGSNGLCVFNHYLASCGVNKVNAIKYFDIDAQDFTFVDNILPEFINKSTPVKINISYESNSGRIIGVQLYAKEDIHLATHFFSLAIQEQKTLNDLVLTDLLFLPHYNKPLNFIFMAIMQARNNWLANK